MSDSTQTELTTIREGHAFDEKALEEYLRRHVEGFSGSLTVRQFEGGQSNPTFLLEAGGKKYVMRKKPPGKLLPSAHAVDREYQVIKALGQTDVPVAKAYCLCEDDAVIGTSFYVMEHVAGRIFRQPLCPQAKDNEERAAIYDAMNDTLARLHKVDWKAAGLKSFGKTGNYMARQIGRWSKQYEASRTHDIPSMDKLLEWLPANIPASDETTIAHGDFRLENMIIHPTAPKVLAVLDWELSTLGHPLADLAYNCMLYHLPPRAGATSGATSGFLGIDVKKHGIPTEKEYVAAYARRTGRDEEIPDYDFFMAFSMFRLAAIVQGVYKRGLDGNASSQNALQYKDVVGFLAMQAIRVLGKKIQ